MTLNSFWTILGRLCRGSDNPSLVLRCKHVCCQITDAPVLRWNDGSGRYSLDCVPTKTFYQAFIIIINFILLFPFFLSTNYLFKVAPVGTLHCEHSIYLYPEIERFHMTSRPSYWCFKPILWDLNSFLMQTLSFVILMSLLRCWPSEWKRSILISLSLFTSTKYIIDIPLQTV